MKKIIILFLILSIFLLGCSQGTNYNQSANPSQPSVGGGCGVQVQTDYNSDFGKLTNTEIKEGF